MDEFQYWQDQSNQGRRAADKERAQTFVDLFQPISQEYGALETLSLTEAQELVEQTQDSLDDVWKQTDVDPYSEERMKHFMDVIGQL